MCKENFNFLFKHLESVLFDTGLTSLVQKDALHDTYYKQLRYSLNELPITNQLKLTAQIAYVTQSSVGPDASNLITCAICSTSQILVATTSGFQKIYENGIFFNSPNGQGPLPPVAMDQMPLTSKRYVSDFSFGKDATLFHYISNR